MIDRVDLVEGWTETVTFTLKADGDIIDLTGRTVTMRARDKNGNDPAFVGKVSIIDADGGVVGFTPDAADLLAAESPYTIRFKILGDGYFVPNGEPITLVVRAD